jgi:hypothetical protein
MVLHMGRGFPEASKKHLENKQPFYLYASRIFLPWAIPFQTLPYCLHHLHRLTGRGPMPIMPALSMLQHSPSNRHLQMYSLPTTRYWAITYLSPTNPCEMQSHSFPFRSVGSALLSASGFPVPKLHCTFRDNRK